MAANVTDQSSKIPRQRAVFRPNPRFQRTSLIRNATNIPPMYKLESNSKPRRTTPWHQFGFVLLADAVSGFP